MDMYVHANVVALDVLVDPHAMPWRSKLQTEFGVYHLGWVGGPGSTAEVLRYQFDFIGIW